MKRVRTARVRLLAALMAGTCAALPGAIAADGTAAAPAAADAARAARQVLVMLRMPAPHFRAGTDYGGYGSGAGAEGDSGDPGRPARRRTAEALARAHGLRVVDGWPMPLIGVDCYVMEGVADDQAALLSALARDPHVAWAQPVNLFHGMAQGDPLYPLQPDAGLWHLAELHRVSTGRGVRVAVVDSGVDRRHPDLSRQVEIDENFVDQGEPPPEIHGTAVAGIIAASAGNGLGVAGVAPGVRLMALRACREGGAAAAADGAQGARCTSFTLAKALHFAILHDARVINLSLGGPADRLLQTLVDTAVVRGAAVVGAFDPRRPGGFPTGIPGVLAVSAAARGRTLPADGGTLSAPGADVPTCLPGARWGFVSGSSYAAAHVSGLAALLGQLLPRAGAAELRSYMMSGAPSARTSAATMERTANRGAGPASGLAIDACAAMTRAAGRCVCSCSSP